MVLTRLSNRTLGELVDVRLAMCVCVYDACEYDATIFHHRVIFARHFRLPSIRYFSRSEKLTSPPRRGIAATWMYDVTRTLCVISNYVSNNKTALDPSLCERRYAERACVRARACGIKARPIDISILTLFDLRAAVDATSIVLVSSSSCCCCCCCRY